MRGARKFCQRVSNSANDFFGGREDQIPLAQHNTLDAGLNLCDFSGDLDQY